MTSILVVDDDGHIREIVRFALEQAGHNVTEARDGQSVLQLIENNRFDIIVLDIVMPGIDGFSLCQKIRQQSEVPIIFLSSRDEELDRILGLELGADDYLGKPFSPRELVARVKAVIRRTHSSHAPRTPQDTKEHIVHGPLFIDVTRHLCTWEENAVVLTVTEFALLVALAQSPGRVYTRGQLVDLAYGTGHVITDRTVDSHIRRIRKKLSALGGEPIETVFGLGYRFREALI